MSKTTPISHSFGKNYNTAYTYETDILCALNFALELTSRAFLLEVARTTNKLPQTPKVAQKLPSTIETGLVILVSPITILSEKANGKISRLPDHHTLALPDPYKLL